MNAGLLDTLLGLQIFQVLFLALHDWIPLGRLNDIKAAREASPNGKLFVVTLLSALPYAFGLALFVLHWGEPFRGLEFYWLWASYLFLFIGELRAWWIPYLVTVEPARAARYDAMFGNTWAFLPARNGIRPNALHILLHVSTLLTLVLLAAISR